MSDHETIFIVESTRHLTELGNLANQSTLKLWLLMLANNRDTKVEPCLTIHSPWYFSGTSLFWTPWDTPIRIRGVTSFQGVLLVLIHSYLRHI